MTTTRVLLDTSIVVHREANTAERPEIGILFKWLERFHCTKCLHPLTLDEIRTHQDASTLPSFEVKLSTYTILKTLASEPEAIRVIRQSDTKERARIGTSLLNEVFAERVDLLITEDRNVHQKAAKLGIDDKVYTIEEFIEKTTAENPDLSDYKVLAVKKELFGNIDVSDAFFDSFRRDYVGFDKWFNKKADETAYICRDLSGKVSAFLYVKVEDSTEHYPDIQPVFMPKRRLKIGTFKVMLNGYTLGERLLKVVFDNAHVQRVEEIYLTIFNRDEGQERLITLLATWGFRQFGVKTGASGEELVLVRDFSPVACVYKPSLAYPFMSRGQRKFIVPIYPEYHTELLPDSILTNERPANFSENRANRNALKKAYISRSIRRDMKPGDIIVFYRTKTDGPAHHTAVVTTLGVVESVVTGIQSQDQFLRLCRKRSVFTEAELLKHWNYDPGNRPFVVNFLYVQSFPAPRPNLARLKAEGIIQDAPRGFDEISNEAFAKLLEISHADQSLIVNQTRIR